MDATRRAVSPSGAMGVEEAAIRAYYDRGEERDRLTDGAGQLEFLRTTEILARRLPPPPAVIADIGGGPAAMPCGSRRSAIRSSTGT